MVTFPNAKINIGLNITEKRPDGFHNIESVFYPVPCFDALEIIEAESTSFKSTGIEIPGNSAGNLCLKAYNLLKADYELPNYSIQLLKSIPIGAGLGGGSADGAFMLKLINEKAKLNIPEDELESYARKMGSDCAFFIQNTPKYCFQKGDEFEMINLSLKGKYLVLINPNIHISTAEAYSGIVPQKTNQDLRALINEPIAHWKNTIKNDFEKTLFLKYPILSEIKQKLYKSGAVYSTMTGSGSTVYGIFENEINLKDFQNYWAYSCVL